MDQIDKGESLGRIAYDAAAKVTGCEQPWEEANQAKWIAAAQAVRDKGEPIPPEVLDLLRFMCATWSAIDRFVYQHCNCDALEHYPVVQGTRNQILLLHIGEQPHDTANIGKAAEWMQRHNKQ